MGSTIQCIGFILDGNRRWAKEKGIPKLLCHKAGFDKLEACVRWVRDRGIPHMAVYAFSTENWQREKDEVDYLMDLYREFAEDKFNRMMQEGAAVRFVGALDKLPVDVQASMKKTESRNVAEPNLTLWVCVSYGSRAEITTAASEAVAGGAPITEEILRAHMWSAGMPDPDIIVRTG